MTRTKVRARAQASQGNIRELKQRPFLSHRRQPEVETSPLRHAFLPFHRKCQVINARMRAFVTH